MYKICLNLKSFDLDYLIQIENYLLSVYSFFNLDHVKNQIKSKKCKKITILRSPHIDKKSREQFQITRHKKMLVLTLSNKNFLLLIFEIIKDLKFIGVELEILIEFDKFSI